MEGNWVSGRETVENEVIPKVSSYPQLNNTQCRLTRQNVVDEKILII